MNQPLISQVLAVYSILILFGVVFNWLIAIAENHGWLEGYTALAVALGVLVTLSALAFISWQYALIALGAFACSGAPMLAGSIYRHVKARERFHQELRGE